MEPEKGAGGSSLKFALALLIPVLITFLVTSGVWIGVYFLAGLNNREGPSNNYYYNYGNPNTTNAPPPSTVSTPTSAPDGETCSLQGGQYSQCTADCELMLCESIPSDLYPASEIHTMNTTQCWLRLIREAKKEIVIGSYYWTLLLNTTAEVTDDLGFAADGKLIFDGLVDAAKRNISIRIAVSDAKSQGYSYAEPFAIRDVNPQLVRVRSLNFPNWFPYGILHTKSWSVDGKHSYVGSANFDWRSLAQVKELGMAAFNCPCIAEDVQRILDILWDMGAENSVLPSSWPTKYSTNAHQSSPYVIQGPQGPPTSISLSSSPPGLNSCGRDNDIDAMVKLIDEAQEYVLLAVMEYTPSTAFAKPNFYYDKLDAAIRRAAYDRFVGVRFLMARWNHTHKTVPSYLKSFEDYSIGLPYTYVNNKKKQGYIDVKWFEMPDQGFETIPYARVQHNKYFVTDKAAYIGTSNWSADYWLWTAGIGVTIWSADAGGQETLWRKAKNIFERDWHSKYAKNVTSPYL